MNNTKSKKCPSLILGEGTNLTPPIACRSGYQPEIIEGTIMSDSRCIFVEKGYVTENCVITRPEFMDKVGNAPPESLAQPRIIRNKERS